MLSLIALASQDTAPWWGTPLVAGGFTIIGAAVAFWSERRKFTREETQRRNKQVRETCTKFSGVIEADFNNMVDVGTRPETYKDWGWRNNVEVATAWTELELVAPEDVLKAAYDLYMTYTGMQISFDLATHGYGQLQRWIRLFKEVQLDYINVVRNKYDLAPLSRYPTPRKLDDLMKDMKKKERS